ncbi:MAG TPA: hypothetical protein VEO02_06245 [Thermoanaerobaculia bacterium]|nr:hypothetical protein [Thermoanaerobaculia bacterium]
MKGWIGAIAVLAFLATGVALGQTKVESVTKEKSAQGTSKTKTKTVTGTVKEYEAGKKIKITGPADKSYSFDLDENARIEGNIAVGQTAKVEYTKDNQGKEHVTVLSESKAAAEPSRSAAEGSEARASHTGGTMHMEAKTEHKGPGPNTKVKTESVIGTVKKYEAGKKITVTGPKDKDYSFDLDENVAMKGSVNVGERVKVGYTKSDGGDKVTTVMAYPAAAKKKTKKTAT